MNTNNATARSEWAVFFRNLPDSPRKVFDNEYTARKFAREANRVLPEFDPPAFYVARRTKLITPWETA